MYTYLYVDYVIYVVGKIELFETFRSLYLNLCRVMWVMPINKMVALCLGGMAALRKRQDLCFFYIIRCNFYIHALVFHVLECGVILLASYWV